MPFSKKSHRGDPYYSREEMPEGYFDPAPLPTNCLPSNREVYKYYKYLTEQNAENKHKDIDVCPQLTADLIEKVSNFIFLQY